MKRPSAISISLLLFIGLATINISQAQILIQTGPEITPTEMVEKILGVGIIYENVVFHGADVAGGMFTNADSTNLGFGSGIFLTSGSGSIIPGPNLSTNAGANNLQPGYSLLDTLTTGTVHDAAVLEFDFYPVSDTLSFRYVFGSEEYNEYVNSSFNDVFGFFISGSNPLGGFYANKNIAIVPGTSNTNVSVNNVNNGYADPGEVSTGPCEYCQYYHDNIGGLTLEYDGLTTVLTAWILVVPCESYHLVLGIADVGDYIFDLGVFIEESSIESPTFFVESNLTPAGIIEDIVEGHVAADIVFKLTNPDYAPLTINWELIGTANHHAYPQGDFEEEIPTSITFEEGQDSAIIHVVPVKDGIIEGDETLILIVENNLGCFVSYDTVEFTILDYVDMDATTSPNTMICSGQEVDLWVNVNNGFPPYTYLWEPGGFTNDSISVSPEETTTYKVIYHDIFMESDSNEVQIFVMPLNYEILSFSFETENNPFLPWDVIGQIFEDSIALDVPIGTNLSNLVATFSLSETAWAYVNGELQENNITANDFTNPVNYEINAPGGCKKDWIVNVNLVTGNQNEKGTQISIYPNPANEQIHINNAAGYEVSLVNSLGRELTKKIIRSQQYFIDISDFEEGIYYLKFTYERDWFVEKIVVKR